MGDAELNLDYDNELAFDAQQFGLEAQGAALEAVKPASRHVLPPVLPQLPPSKLPKELHEALIIAREVYGETNSEHSEVFCDWINDVMTGTSSLRETKEMLNVLHSDKENFGGHIAWTKGKKSLKKEAVYARRHASICAMNVTRAVLNRFKGLEYTQWLERALWRAVQAEKDMKGIVL